MGDIDGAIVVPCNIAYNELDKAEEVLENEKRIFGWVAEGNLIEEITEQGGYFSNA